MSVFDQLERILSAVASNEDLSHMVGELKQMQLLSFAEALEVYLRADVDALRELEDRNLAKDDLCAYLSRYLLIALGAERPSRNVVDLLDRAIGGSLDLEHAIDALSRYVVSGNSTDAFLLADVLSFIDDVEKLRVRRAIVERAVGADDGRQC